MSAFYQGGWGGDLDEARPSITRKLSRHNVSRPPPSGSGHDEENIKTLKVAYDAGERFWDTSDVYFVSLARIPPRHDTFGGVFVGGVGI